MELQQLRYFVAVAETENVGRAAERLHISQSPLSRQIRQLEDHLGLQLFERVKQRVRLTTAGREFLGEARNLLAQAERVEEQARRAGRGEACSLGIGYCEGVIHSGRLPAALRRFRADYPRVNLRLSTMRSGEQADALEHSAIDLGFVYNLPKSADTLASRLLSREPFVLVAAVDHPLAAVPTVTPQDLDGLPWIAFPKALNPMGRARLLEACESSGFQPDIQFEAPQISIILGLVSAGLGVAVMQESIQRLNPPGVVFKRLDWLPLSVEVHLLWRAQARSAALCNFMNVLDLQA
ncbi:LysR family transcriptional regulator [Ralstonia thomasii]|jgi:DNA-binding transcriptional LysR family regulator